MKLSKCCNAEVIFAMVDDRVGHGMHEETECSNCSELYPEVYDDEEEDQTTIIKIINHIKKNQSYESIIDRLKKSNDH